MFTLRVMQSSRARLALTLPKAVRTAAATPKCLHSTDSSKETKPSFINRVAAGGADLLLGAFVSTGTRFDRNLEGLTVTEMKPGWIKVEFTVPEGLSNAYGTLHGGATATIIDVVTTMALLSQDPLRAGVSVDLNCSYLSAAKVGEKVTAEATVLRSGKKLGFTECVLYKQEPGKEKVLIATGRHTKAL
jgi:acyl-coenzyme A thioesterase 13